MSKFVGTKSISKYMSKTKIIVMFFQGHSFGVLKRWIDQADHRTKVCLLLHNKHNHNCLFLYINHSYVWWWSVSFTIGYGL